MFNSTTGIMLYVQDVLAEKAFWQALGLVIEDEGEMMGYPHFSMRPNAAAGTVFTVFDKAFIEQHSPEVASNVPSVLFESSDIHALRDKVAALTETASPVQEIPFLTFNFASPSGIYFAVKGV